MPRPLGLLSDALCKLELGPEVKDRVDVSVVVRGDERDCGVDLLRAFLRDPRADLDLSCMDEVVPLTFDGTDDAPRYMDRPNWWDNP